MHSSMKPRRWFLISAVSAAYVGICDSRCLSSFLNNTGRGNMSTLIYVEQARPIQIDVLLSESSKAIRSILGLSFDPELSAKFRWKTERPMPETYWLDQGFEDISIQLQGESADVTVSESAADAAVVVSPNMWRTVLEYALAAAVAIALAKYSGGEISDSASAYTKVYRQMADKFTQSIKVEGTYDNIKDAAQAFAVRLGWER
jgi:hypothetical protein